MASNATGRQVARAASTGGGRTYRGQAPANWYAGLVLIVVVGLLLVGFSRYQRIHPDLSSAGSPTTSDTWHAALAIDVCGTMEPNLPAKTSTTTGLTTNGTGVVTISPMNSSESGGNATLGKFVSEYPGLTLTSTTLQYPGKTLETNGQTCAKGTPDAGRPGFVVVESWPNFTSTTGTAASGNPTLLKFANAQLITVGFLPAGAHVPKPSPSTITALIKAVSGTSSTTSSTTTTTPRTTTTTAPPKATTTTTVPPKETTTTKVPPTTTTISPAPTVSPTTIAEAPATAPTDTQPPATAPTDTTPPPTTTEPPTTTVPPTTTTTTTTTTTPTS